MYSKHVAPQVQYYTEQNSSGLTPPPPPRIKPIHSTQTPLSPHPPTSLTLQIQTSTHQQSIYHPNITRNPPSPRLPRVSNRWLTIPYQHRLNMEKHRPASTTTHVFLSHPLKPATHSLPIHQLQLPSTNLTPPVSQVPHTPLLVPPLPPSRTPKNLPFQNPPTNPHPITLLPPSHLPTQLVVSPEHISPFHRYIRYTKYVPVWYMYLTSHFLSHLAKTHTHTVRPFIHPSLILVT
jgi:hypothetical protein